MKDAKQEIIKKSYGEYWEYLKDYVDQNGWIKYLILLENYNIYKLLTYNIILENEVNDLGGITFVRPESLKGIENNNGWILLIDTFSLPSAKGHYWFVTKNGKITQNYFNAKSKEDGYRQHFMNIYTHYKPIIKPKPPIF